MKLVAFIVALVAGFVLLNIGTLTGNVARNPMPWPGVDALTLHGHMVDVNEKQLPPGNLIVTDPFGNFVGEGGIALVDYTLTLKYGWHEYPPVMHVYYMSYADKIRRYCTGINLYEVFTFPSYDYTVYINLKCEFAIS